MPCCQSIMNINLSDKVKLLKATNLIEKQKSSSGYLIIMIGNNTIEVH